MTPEDPLKDIDLDTLMRAWHGLAKREQDQERILEREAGRREDKGVWALDERQRDSERVVLSLEDTDDDATAATEATVVDQEHDDGTEMSVFPMPDQ